MTGYREAHGDEAAIALVLHNYQPLYKSLQKIVALATWHHEDQTWRDVDRAEKYLRGYVSELDSSTAGYQDLEDIDFASVNWRSLIVRELRQENLFVGRVADAGLSAWT